MIEVAVEKKIKTYKGLQLFQVKRNFQPGSITRIIGPSGAGKTTLLLMIAGLLNPDDGRIVAGDSIWFEKSSEINISPQQRRTGFVFQHYALFPNMTVKQHLSYATEDEDWKDFLLNFAGLKDFEDHKPGALSGGQQQRLAVVRALANKPKILLMDEPFSAIDFKMKSGLIDGLQDIFKDIGTTVLIVSHNPQELDGMIDDELDLSQ